MTTLQRTVIGLVIPFLVAFDGKEEPFIVIKNSSPDKVYVEIWSFPDTDGEGRERVCAMSDIVQRDSTFLVVADSIELYHLSEISAVYEKKSFDGFDIMVYIPKEKPVVQCATSTIKIGRDDSYASPVVSTKFGIGRKVEGIKALFS
jgi:hypothetical protein